MKSGWSIKCLGEIAEIFDSLRKPVTKSDRKSGPYPYYGASGVQDYVDSYLFDGRYLLVGEDGAKWGAGDKSAYIIEGKSWVNNHAHILKVRNNILDKYLEYYLVFSDLTEYITGAIVPKLTQKALCSIPIPIPPIDEQKRIVDELDLLTGIIDKKNAQLRDLDALAQSIFYNTFGDPILNEKNWPVKRLREICDIINGFSFKSQLFKETGDTILRISNIQNEDVVLDDAAHFDKSDYPKVNFSKYEVLPNDIVVALSGATTGKLGINRTGQILYLNQRVAICREKRGSKIYHSYLYHYLKQQSKSFLESAAGVAQPNLSTEDMKDYVICIPDNDSQDLFEFKINNIETQRAHILSSLGSVNELLESRMDLYFG